MDLQQIQDFWVNAGQNFPKDAPITPTSRDPYLGQLERTNILRYLKSDTHVVEVGCGDGSHSLEYAQNCRSYRGYDISPGLLDVARQRFAHHHVANAKFACGSVLDLMDQVGVNGCDTVVTQRCLINLPTWELQKQALDAIASILKPGGVYLMTEGFTEPLEELNLARQKVGLDPIRVVPYNRNLTLREFSDYIPRKFEVVAIYDYGFYLYISRVLHPMAVNPESPRHDGPINRAAWQLSASAPPDGFRKFSYNLFYVLRKR